MNRRRNSILGLLMLILSFGGACSTSTEVRDLVAETNAYLSGEPHLFVALPGHKIPPLLFLRSDRNEERGS